MNSGKSILVVQGLALSISHRRVKSPQNRSVEFFFVSGRDADAASREAALAAGFTAFVAKPARPHELVELVWSLLHRGR